MKNRMTDIKGLLAAAAVLLMLQGCDFVRSVAGRPTSADIQAKAQAIAVQQEIEAAQAARDDSLRAVQRAVQAEQAAADSLQGKIMFIKRTQMRSRLASDLPSRYVVVLGAFTVASNAEAFAAKLEDKGYKASLIPYVNGSVAVGVGACDAFEPLYRTVAALKDEPLRPEDAWVLVNE